MNSLDADLELVNVIQSIEDSEDVDTILESLLDKVVNSVVRKRRVRNTIGATEKHLEGNVRYKLSHLPEAVPRILVEEAHGDIEGGATPALKTVKVGKSMTGLLRDVEEINCADTGGQE